MVSTALVNIWDTLAGAIAWDDSTGIGSFEFEPSFINSGWDLSPIKMPLSAASNTIFSFR